MVLAGVGALAVALPMEAGCQSAPAGAPSAEQRLGYGIREIDGFATGDRWLLVRDTTNPGGPGRMVRIETGKADSTGGVAGEPARKGTQSPVVAPLRPVIHAGDAVIVEEHTSVVDARLEAQALGSAVVGAQFRARLKIGGKVLRVVALAEGRAEMTPEKEAQQ
ncbi:MAG: hypothetical protein ABSE53_00465 [Terracidiphilus sp.]